jgi:hypothetical protein
MMECKHYDKDGKDSEYIHKIISNAEPELPTGGEA